MTVGYGLLRVLPGHPDGSAVGATTGARHADRASVHARGCSAQVRGQPAPVLGIGRGTEAFGAGPAVAPATTTPATAATATAAAAAVAIALVVVFVRSEEHTSELQSRENLVCRLLLEKKKYNVR